MVGASHIAEPEGSPASVAVLMSPQVAQGAAPAPGQASAQASVGGGAPGVPGGAGVGREVGAAPVEGQATPAAAEGGEAAVAVLQIHEPQEPLADGAVQRRAEPVQREERAGGVVAIGNGAGPIAPTPAARRGSSEGMPRALLGRPQVGQDGRAVKRVVRRGGQGARGERSDPEREIGVDGPGAVGALALAEETAAAAGHGAVAESRRR